MIFFLSPSLASTAKTRYNYLAHKATDKELAAFLSYVNGKAAESSFTKNLDNEVKRIRDSEDWRFHAMFYEAETQFHEWLGATLPQHLPETGQMFFYKD